MKLRLPTNLSVMRLEHLADELAGSVGLDGDFVGLVARALGRRRAACPAPATGRKLAMASSSSATPMSFLGGRCRRSASTVPAASALGRAAISSSAPTSPSSRYFSIRASSASTMASTSCERGRGQIDRAAGRRRGRRR